MNDELKPMDFTDEEKLAMMESQYWQSHYEYIYDCLLGHKMHKTPYGTAYTEEKHKDALKAIKYGYVIRCGKPHPQNSDFCDVETHALYSSRLYDLDATNQRKQHMVRWCWMVRLAKYVEGE